MGCGTLEKFVHGGLIRCRGGIRDETLGGDKKIPDFMKGDRFHPKSPGSEFSRLTASESPHNDPHATTMPRDSIRRR